MEYVGSIVTYGVSYQIRNERSKEIIEKTNKHVNELINLIKEMED
jgi:predicted 3-demethylubiquinone-9 3-methyltransferase (glyoxalase superfamily)